MLILVTSYGPTVTEHMAHARDPAYLNDDARAVLTPYFSWTPQGFAAGYPEAYHLAGTPLGVRSAYSVLARFFDPAITSSRLPYLLWVGTAAAVAAAAHRLGGAAAAVGSLALFLGSAYPMARLVGALPRAYALPIVGLGAWALITNRKRALAVSVVLGAAFYPASGILTGTALAMVLVVTALQHRSSRRYAGVLLAITTTCAATLVVPLALRFAPFGPSVKRAAFSELPEASPQGRLQIAEDRVETDLRSAVRRSGRVALVGARPWLPTLRSALFSPPQRKPIAALFVAILLLGFLYLLRAGPPARRLSVLLLAAAGLYLLAQIAFPYLYLPGRYTAYAVPVLAWILAPASLVALRRRFAAGRRWLDWVAIGALLLALGGRGDPKAGYTSVIDISNPVFAAVSALDSQSLVAAWPRGLADNLPYWTRRPVLANYESHLPYHRAYVLEMRRRVQAIIAAYWARSNEPLHGLRRDFGVTHFLVDKRLLSGDAPSYFAPFDQDIDRAHSATAEETPAVLRLAPSATVYEDERYLLVDLVRLAKAPSP